MSWVPQRPEYYVQTGSMFENPHGVPQDFYKICVRASAYTGRGLGFDHRDDSDDNQESGGLDSSIRKYLKEYGIDLSEYADAMKGEY